MNIETARSIRGLGWKPDIPDVNDFLWADHKWRAGPSIAAAPQSNIIAKVADMPAHYDQGNTGSCVGQSTAGAVNFLRRTDADKISTTYSARYAYYMARLKAGDGSEKVDDGAYIRDSIKALIANGIAPLSSWPWSEPKINAKPTATATKAADRWKLGAYIRCQSLTDVREALSAGHPVILGFSCYENMFTAEVDRSGVLPMPSGKMVGGHAIWLFGHDDPSRYLDFWNSWGLWGLKGNGKMPYGFLEPFGALADDAWALIRQA